MDNFLIEDDDIKIKKFEKNDLKALQSDWEKVGNDIRNAMSEYDKQYKVGK